MRNGTIEIKFYGTGGHGIVVAAKLLADAAVKGGYNAQSFASYGAARRGGKVESYVRISDQNVLLHSKIYKPDFLVVMDKSLLKDAVAPGLKEGGVVLVNAPDLPETFSGLGVPKVVTVDADHVATEKGLQMPSGARIINTTMLGAIAGLVPSIGIEDLTQAINEGGIPQPKKNADAAQEAYRRVKSQAAGTAVAEKPKAEATPQVAAERQPRHVTKIAPCEANCPAGETVEKTAALIRDGRFDEALQSIKAENPFPGICGRVCFHPCETACNRKDYDEAIANNALERAAFDYGKKTALKPVRKKTGKKVAVIGSGPAGMTCAYFLALLGHGVTVYEALPVLGGIPRVGIPKYRLPKDIVETEIGQILELGVKAKTSTAVGKDISFQKMAQEHDACFIATGAQRSTKLDVTGESSKGVLAGLDFLREVNTGGSFDLGAKVAVIGGGNTAIDAARTAKRLGAIDVTVVYRRSAEEMPANAEEISAARQEGIKFLFLAAPAKVLSKRGRVDSLECIRMKLGEPDASGRKRPIPVKGSEFTIEVDSVIAAIGEALDASYLPKGLEVAGSLIKVDALGRTSLKGIYAGGDAVMRAGSVSNAIGSGKRAAIGIDVFLRGADDRSLVKTIGKENTSTISMESYLAGDAPTRDGPVVAYSELNLNYFDKAARAKLRELSVSSRTANFEEVRSALTRQKATKEADRCFHCGHCNLCENCFILCPEVAVTFDPKTVTYTVNYDICKTCGICIAECPRSAIVWEGAS